jgi:hypothetical protein
MSDECKVLFETLLAKYPSLITASGNPSLAGGARGTGKWVNLVIFSGRPPLKSRLKILLEGADEVWGSSICVKGI